MIDANYRSSLADLSRRDRAIFWLMAALLHTLSVLPDMVLCRLGIVGGWIAFQLDRGHRKIGMRNLEVAFPERSDRERQRILRASYLNLGRTAAEYIRLGGFFFRRVKRTVSYQGMENLERAQREYPGKGVIALSAHLGNFEMLAPVHAMFGYPISLVHHTLRFLPADALLTYVRERAGVRIIRKHKAAREMLRSLARGELIGIPFDQNAKRSEALWVPFFGQLAATPSALDRIALISGAPVLPAFIFRQADGRSHVIEISPEVAQQRTSDKEADVLENTRRYQNAIEVAVRNHPEQFLWTHRRYRTRPVRGDRSFYVPQTAAR